MPPRRHVAMGLNLLELLVPQVREWPLEKTWGVWDRLIGRWVIQTDDRDEATAAGDRVWDEVRSIEPDLPCPVVLVDRDLRVEIGTIEHML